MRQPAHINKKTSPAIFDSVLQLERLFDFRLDEDLDVQVGDFITFKEWDGKEEKFTGRSLTRRISYVLRTKELELPKDALTKYGLLLLGLVPTEYRLLRSVLGQSYIVSTAITKVDTSPTYKITDGPSYLPAIVCPQFDIGSLLIYAKVDKWPPGLYSVQWMINVKYPEEDRSSEPEIEIADVMVWTWKEAEDDLEIMELDVFALRDGNPKTEDGTSITPVHPDNLPQYEGELDNTLEDNENQYDNTDMMEYWSDERLTEALLGEDNDDRRNENSGE